MIDFAVIVITLASLMASFVNAAFATGGVYIMLLASVWVLPVSAAIPLQSAFAAASLAARIHFFWEHIRWSIATVFVLGCFIGVYFGARTFVALPESTLSIMLGLVLLTLLWMPKWKRGFPIRHPFFFVGVLHSYLGALLGVGGVLQPSILRTSLTKLEITGTLAVCLLVLDGLKVTAYVSFGFSYFDYVPHIVGATIAGFVGTWLGKRVTHVISEETFRIVFKIFFTVAAPTLIYTGWTN